MARAARMPCMTCLCAYGWRIMSQTPRPGPVVTHNETLWRQMPYTSYPCRTLFQIKPLIPRLGKPFCTPLSKVLIAVPVEQVTRVLRKELNTCVLPLLVSFKALQRFIG